MGRQDSEWTVRSYRSPMHISYIVRLRSEALAEGRFVGEVEAVTSRQRQRIRNIEQFTAFVRATMASQTASKQTAREIALEVDLDDTITAGHAYPSRRGGALPDPRWRLGERP